jgi:hypothetical protein
MYLTSNASGVADTNTGMTVHQTVHWERHGTAVPPQSKEIEMRRTILTLASFATLIAASLSAAPAQAANDRYCLQGRSWGYPGNCQFATYQQCAATASGTSAFCGINPRYAYSQPYYY